ncbi:hypothetical protein NQ315_006317 [Exocentrus adspersus]|uniref:Peptidase M14 domain-containing protein n=1 Tax=Exocentrus adspersus TaxID=1586481 RepID=A0AAV8VZX4_9CUCU|nr:hypothetical protein NQ315_006317 [Exocentrus adspersus]
MNFQTTFFVCLCIQVSLAEKIRYDNYKVFSLTPRSADAVKALYEMEEMGMSGYNFWSRVGPVGTPVQVMVPPYKVGELEATAEKVGMDMEVMLGNVQEQIDAEARAETEEESGFGWTKYNTLDEINDWLENITVQYAPNVTLLHVNHTYEGRSIVGVKVSFGPGNENRSVFIESTIHAREWITAATTTYILNELLSSENATIRNLAESHDWYFFPVFNPDGYEYTHTTDRMWRKTRVPHSILCSGADPNRNWDYYWNHGGTSGSPCTETFRGPQPFSEPCCRIMSEFITSIGEQLVAYISFHSFSQLLLIPYGYTPEHLENYEQIYQIGLKSAEALAQRYGTQYRVGTVYETIYQASGSSADWVKGVFKTPIVYGYELRDQGQYGFLLPPDQIVPTAEETFDSLITIFREYYADVATQ